MYFLLFLYKKLDGCTNNMISVHKIIIYGQTPIFVYKNNGFMYILILGNVTKKYEL